LLNFAFVVVELFSKFSLDLYDIFFKVAIIDPKDIFAICLDDFNPPNMFLGKDPKLNCVGNIISYIFYIPAHI
jgi:hypothetical protein